MSLPVPPFIVSDPSPPSIMSSPALPKSVSLPSKPKRSSSPPWPPSKSPNPLPIIKSFPANYVARSPALLLVSTKSTNCVADIEKSEIRSVLLPNKISSILVSVPPVTVVALKVKPLPLKSTIVPSRKSTRINVDVDTVISPLKRFARFKLFSFIEIKELDALNVAIKYSPVFHVLRANPGTML